jgi:hypothetical protein
MTEAQCSNLCDDILAVVECDIIHDQHDIVDALKSMAAAVTAAAHWTFITFQLQ